MATLSRLTADRTLRSEIRAHEPGVRVLLMSGYTTAALEPHGLAEGDVVLQKPFTKDSLARAVREALTRSP